jgi:hypothetical protein
MKILTLLSCLMLVLLALSGCTKEPEAEKAVTPPAGVSQAQGGGPQVQQRGAGAVSNQ